MGQIYDSAGNPASDSFLNDPQNFKLPFDVISYHEFNREVFAKYEALLRGKFAYYDRIKKDPDKAGAAEKLRIELDVLLSMLEVMEGATQGYVGAWVIIKDTWEVQLTNEKRRAQAYFKWFLVASEGEKLFLEMANKLITTPSNQPKI